MTINLAKSLHTITVYERLISYFMSIGYTDTDAAQFTREILQHDKMTDDYGLVEKGLVKARKNHEVQ